MDRSVFIRRIIRLLLLGMLAVIAAFTGGRLVSGSACASCPGKGICKGEDDCLTYLSR